MNTIIIEGSVRDEIGKSANKKLRREKMVPGIVYGGDETILFHANEISFRDLLKSPSFCKVKLVVGENSYECILKDVQYHPVTDRILHVDLLQLVEGKKVITEIPIKTEGRSLGVVDGGKLLKKVRKLKIKALPEHLVDFIAVDVTDLELNKSIKVEELSEANQNLEIITPGNIPVASVVIPRALRSEESELEDEEGEESAEGDEGTEGEKAEGAEGTKD